MPTVLAVDDDPAILEAFRAVLERKGIGFVGATDAATGFRAVRERPVDVVLCDLLLPDEPGLGLFRRIRDLAPAVPVIIVTGQESADLAIEATVNGAFDFLTKPFTAAGLLAAVSRAIEAAGAAGSSVAVSVPTPTGHGPTLVGRCPPMQQVYRAVGRVAPQRMTVLVTGESGTGKELVARAVHQHSGRADRAFVAVNCAALPENLLESELFGHEKGAFTGADRQRKGRFEQADGGTLFLDEVGELTPGTQAKLLRVLQEQAFERVGGEETVRTDTRVIAATNRDLATMVAEGKFRDDLFYRLSGYAITLPPLRDGGDDLILLTQHFLGRLQAELGVVVLGLSPEAADRLKAYHWPGNLRELQGVLRRAMLEATGPVLTADLLSLGSLVTTPKPIGSPRTSGLFGFVEARLAAGTVDLYAEWLEREEPELFGLVLEHFGGNLTRAAEALGINRMTLRSRVRRYGLKDDQSPPARG